MKGQQRHPTLECLEPLAGEWAIEATHRLMPGEIIRGRTTFEWLDGGMFLIWRSHYDHPAIPDSIAIIGHEDPEQPKLLNPDCTIRYYDVRGVTRRFIVEAEPGAWRYWRSWPGFSQRFIARFTEDGQTITGMADLSEDGGAWIEDMAVTYRRVG